MNKEKIKYLIKFVKEEKYVKDLLNGDLFMRPTIAFIKMFYDEYFKVCNEYNEDTFNEYVKNYTGCIGDFQEASLLRTICIKANTNIPIFCTTYLTNFQTQIKNNKTYIKLSEKVIKEFINDGYKYAVVIDYDKFIEILKNSDKVGGFGPVQYISGDTMEIIMDCFKGVNTGKNLLYKSAYFSYQNEFRVYLSFPDKFYRTCLTKNSYNIYSCDNNGNNRECITINEVYEIYKIGNIANICKTIKMCDAHKQNNEYYFEI